jgi:hypothetical protein
MRPPRTRLGRRLFDLGHEAAVEEGALLRTPAGKVDRYGLALGLIALTIVVDFSLAGETLGAVLGVVLGGGTLLFVLTTSDASARVVKATRVFVGIAVAIAVLAMLAGDSARAQGLITLAGGALALLAPLAIINRLRQHTTITSHTVFGALCLYLLAGLFFAYVYAFVDAVAGPMFADTPVAGLPDTVYFSFVTLATVGYGDLTPGTELARMLAVAEGIGGQLYLVTAIAVLVANLGWHRSSAGPEADAVSSAADASFDAAPGADPPAAPDADPPGADPPAAPDAARES